MGPTELSRSMTGLACLDAPSPLWMGRVAVRLLGTVVPQAEKPLLKVLGG